MRAPETQGTSWSQPRPEPGPADPPQDARMQAARRRRRRYPYRLRYESILRCSDRCVRCTSPLPSIGTSP